MDIEHTSPAVLLFFDKERYLFNAGEGIQRLFREHRLKIRQVGRLASGAGSGLAAGLDPFPFHTRRVRRPTASTQRGWCLLQRLPRSKS